MKAELFETVVQERAQRVHAVVGCCTQNHVRRFRQLNDPKVALIGTATERPIRAGNQRYTLRIREWWANEEAGGTLRGLQYTLLRAETDKEIIAYHEHAGVFATGHYHLGSGLGSVPDLLDGAHIPAPSVTLEMFVAMLIREFAVPPTRSNWAQVLNMPASETGPAPNRG